MKVVVWLALLGLLPNGVFGAAQSSELEFRVLCIGSQLPEGVCYEPVPGESAIELTFREDRRSAAYSYRGPRDLYFFREVPDASGRPLRFSVATASLTPGLRRPLLVFAPGGNAARSEEFSVFVLEEAQQAFAAGTIRFFNATPAELSTRIGEVERVLDTWGPTDFRFQANRNERTPFGLSVQQGDDAKVILNSDLLLFPDRRYLMIVLPPLRPESLRYRLKLLQDAPPAQPMPARGVQ